MIRPALARCGCILFYTKVFPHELAELRHPGEELVDGLPVAYKAGREKRPGEMTTGTFDPLDGLSVDRWNDVATRAIGGLSLDARRGKYAAELAEAADSPSVYLVLTTQRLLVVDGVSEGDEPRLVWSADLSNVAVLRHDPRFPLEMGRMLVGFFDGSLVRLWAGVLIPLAPQRFAASFALTVRR